MTIHVPLYNEIQCHGKLLTSYVEAVLKCKEQVYSTVPTKNNDVELKMETWKLNYVSKRLGLSFGWVWPGLHVEIFGFWLTNFWSCSKSILGWVKTWQVRPSAFLKEGGGGGGGVPRLHLNYKLGHWQATQFAKSLANCCSLTTRMEVKCPGLICWMASWFHWTKGSYMFRGWHWVLQS